MTNYSHAMQGTMKFLVLGLYLGVFGLAMVYGTTEFGWGWLVRPVGEIMALCGAACFGVLFDRLHMISLAYEAREADKKELAIER